MKRFLTVTLALLVSAVLGFFVSAGCKNGSAQSPFQTNLFPYVKVPLAVSSNKRLAAEYEARHYWDEFLNEDRLLRLKPDTSTILGISPKIFEESFLGYAEAISVVDDTIAKNSVTALVDKAVRMAEDGYPPLFGQIMQCAEKTFFEARSPLLNDELYLPVLEGIERCKAIPANVKDSFRWQMEICNKNRVGCIATDFLYATSGGRQFNMHSIKAEYLLIFFNDHDCHNCRLALEEMKKSDVVINMMGMGILKVLSVSPEGKTALWEERKADCPSEWIYAYDPAGELNQGTIYTLRTSPSIYILDEEKRVVVKDASLQHALRVLTSISEHYIAI